MARHEYGTPDDENPEVTLQQFQTSRPALEVLAEHGVDVKRHRGPQKAPTKVAISIRLDRAVLDAYRHTGRGWQGRIGKDLARAAKRLPRKRTRYASTSAKP